MSEDIPESLPLRQSVRSEHLARLEDLQRQRRLVLAGPHPLGDNAGFSGSLVVAEFADLKEAQAWAAADPYVTAGVYQKVVVKPFKQVLP